MTTARSIPARRTEGVHYVAADLSTAEGASAVAQSVLQQLGGIDILVNVLGGSSAPGGGFAVLDDAQWSKELNRRGFGNSCLRESAERSLAQAKPVRAATPFRRCPRARRSPAGIA